jgi:hypothetical protein
VNSAGGVDEHAEKLFRVAVRCDRLGHADEGLETSFKRWGGKNFRIVAHDFAPP